jgi:hypothetical protein
MAAAAASAPHSYTVPDAPLTAGLTDDTDDTPKRKKKIKATRPGAHVYFILFYFILFYFILFIYFD